MSPETTPPLLFAWTAPRRRAAFLVAEDTLRDVEIARAVS